MKNIKSLIISAVVILGIGAFIFYQKFMTNPVNPTDLQPATNPQTSQPSETLNPSTQTGYKDGQYTGAVANTIYGDIQVKAVISGGKITNIVMLKTPTKPGYTAELVASSFPILKSEAIAIQSAKVNIVSGATQNAEGFAQSLASALAQAK